MVSSPHLSPAIRVSACVASSSAAEGDGSRTSLSYTTPTGTFPRRHDRGLLPSVYKAPGTRSRRERFGVTQHAVTFFDHAMSQHGIGHPLLSRRDQPDAGDNNIIEP